ncbi:MAG TPA: IS110 family transposase [Thermomicrobiales bacterium]|nr:IS110 family transposase [Thermomicrobiales bacterium]
MPTALPVGIDIGRHRHAVCLLDQAGGRVGQPFTIPNDRAGATALVERVAGLAPAYDDLQVGMEATGICWHHLYRTLARAPALADHAPRLVAFNPRLIRGFRDAAPARDKTDADDAELIAERLRFGRLPAHPAPDPRYFALQRLTRCRFHLVATVVRTKAQALTSLFLAASEYDRPAPFSDPCGATSTAVLAEFAALDALAAAPLEGLTAFIDAHGRHRFADPAGPARLLKQVAADSFRLDAAAVEPARVVLTSALAPVRFLAGQLGALDRRIARELERFPSTLLSVPGIGPVSAAGLTAEIGDVARFPDNDALAKDAGLWWPRRQSGAFAAEDRALSKAGNAYLRYYLCEAANSLRVHNEEYRRFYDRKYQEALTHAHKRATVLTARKLVRLVYALLRTNQLYAGPGALSPQKPPRRR